MLIEIVEDELLKLYARNVSFRPAPEELPGITKLMMADLHSFGLTDADWNRVRIAFTLIAINEGKWPNSHLVKKYLPEKPKDTVLKLGRPASKETALYHLKRAAEILMGVR